MRFGLVMVAASVFRSPPVICPLVDRAASAVELRPGRIAQIESLALLAELS